jgi:hypothetical protein
MAHDISARTERTPDNPRIVVKLRDDVVLPADARLETHFDALDGDVWREISRQFPALTVHRVFTAVSLERMREIADEASLRERARAREHHPVDFSSYVQIEGPWTGADAAIALRILRDWSAVEIAYVEPSHREPSSLRPGNDPRFCDQGYLRAAPGGIDAVFAWDQPGGGGQGQRFIDLECGWTLDHNDLIKHGAKVLHGQIEDDSRPHGTSVLGVVCGLENSRGGVGVASKLRSVNVVSAHPWGRADAILAATDALGLGGVLLIESQVLCLEVEGLPWNPLPIEVLEAEFQAIRQATARGITVVECAGNGGFDLDDFEDRGGMRLLKRGVRDSGAIIVGAANVSTRPARARFITSNYGSRVDCYAWGEDIDTADSTCTEPFSTTKYRTSFSETSGAAAIIAGAALCIQGIVEASNQPPLDAFEMRDILSNRSTGTASHDPGQDRIGVMPDLRKIIEGFA